MAWPSPVWPGPDRPSRIFFALKRLFGPTGSIFRAGWAVKILARKNQANFGPAHIGPVQPGPARLIATSIGWLTSLVDFSINLAMSLVSHGSLYIHLVDLIFLLRLCVDMDYILLLCMFDCCMTTHLLLDCMLLVYVGHTFIPLSPTP